MTDTYTNLSNQAVIRVKGKDAQTFLQGQLTNDLLSLGLSSSQLSAYCNPKGRAFSIFRVTKVADDYLIQLPKSLLQMILKRLTMFVMISKVTLIDESEQIALLGLTFNSELGISALPYLPTTINEVRTHNELTFIKVPGGAFRYEVMGTNLAIGDFTQVLPSKITESSAEMWQYHSILAGIPELNTVTTELFVPQMLNLDYLKAISFNKGCYTGQEVIARLKYLGKLKRRLYLCRIETREKVEVGDSLFKKTTNNDSELKKVGTVLNVSHQDTNALIFLAVIEIGSALCDQLITEKGFPIKVKELEYPTD